MDQPIKRTNILILCGVFLKDFTTDAFDCAAKPVVKAEPEIAYTEIPKKFTGVDTWPKFSNLLCWSCNLIPESYPKFVPMNPEVDRNGKDTCDVLGNFCEWGCAARYVNEVMPESQRWDLRKFIILFESKFSGARKEIIVFGPPKTEMKAYCGKGGLTPKQWRDKMNTACTEYSMGNYKIESYKDRTS